MNKPTARETMLGSSAQTCDWHRFRRIVEQAALLRYSCAEATCVAQDYTELRQEPFINLIAELEVQQAVQRRLALEYASALDGCRRLQEKIAGISAREGNPSRELDQRLEREVLELAICEEAYELVSEEMEQVRRELARRGAAVR